MTALHGRKRFPTRTVIVAPELDDATKRFNAADPHCEVCHGLGTYKGAKCPCIPRSAA